MTTTGLQCPTCGHIHPLADVAGQGRFRCAGCRRLLSVPESLVAPPAPAEEATQAHPAPPPRQATPDDRRGAPAVPPGPVLPGPAPELSAAIRVPVWILALAFGFVVSAAVLRAVGLLDVDTVLDAFAGQGVGRYGVLLALLPLWAVVSAGTAHLVLEWAARRRARDRSRRGKTGRRDSGGRENRQVKRDEGARRAV